MVTIKYNNVYVNNWFTICGSDEANGNIKNVNMVLKDKYYGEKTLEDAEIKMQKTVINNLSSVHDFNLVIGGDLSNQLGCMNYTLKNNNMSFLGVYGACASFVESMIIGANFISSKQVNKVCLLTSSHELTSERQFRFPIEYGSLKAKYTTVTATGSVGCVISNEKTKCKIISSTIGSVVDYDIKDVANMGAVMAPAASKVIVEHLKNVHKKVNDYDVILTGDLGSLGNELLLMILKEEYGMSASNIIDAGASLYKSNQNKLSGASGPVVLPLYLFNKVLLSKRNKKILIVGTGALHNPTLVNQKKSIPAIAHVVELEVLW